MPRKKKKWTVTGTEKDEKGNITHIYTKEVGRVTTDKAIGEIERGRIIHVDNGPAIHVVDDKYGKYLRTNRDDKSVKNLESI